MISPLPGLGWSVSLWPLPLPFSGDGRARYFGLPDGGVLLALWRRPGLHLHGEAFWDPRSGLWSLLALPPDLLSRDLLVLPVGDPGPLAPVVASLAVSLGLAPSGRVARAVLAAVPGDARGLALALSVMDS